MKFSALRRISLSAFLLAIVILLSTSRPVPAQEAVETWKTPTNLSKAGYTADPVMVLVSNGVLHAVWKDEFKGPVYARMVDGEWTSASSVTVPWGSAFDPSLDNGLSAIFDPQLIADESGRIHAFWIGEESDLYYSVSFSDQFGSNGFSAAVVIANDVISFHAVVDANSTPHVSYVSIEDSAVKPAGVYFQTRNNASGIWSNPAQLYASQYMRGLEEGDVSVDMMVVEDAPEGRAIFTTWDNRPRKQLFMAISSNNGSSWGEPLVVAGPDGILDTNIPNNVGLTVSNNEILLVWKESEENLETNCVQFYQEFTLDGTPLINPQIMFKEFSGCPVGDQYLMSDGSTVLLQASIFGEPYLTAWDGSNWSIPQIQNPLGNFSDPGTFQSLTLQCLYPLLTSSSQILMIGCDTGPGGDIWFTSRIVDNVIDWFTRSADWSETVSLITVGGEINPVVTIPDEGDTLHAIWAQSPSTFESEKNIYYARWDGVGWNYNLIIIQPPFGSVNHLAVALDQAAGKIYLVWSGGERGELYFSWANADLAGNPTEWAAPIQLPMPRPVGTGSDIHVTSTGEIIVAYSIPVNERRGVYIVRSTDGGRLWSTPASVMDGISYGWEVIGSPVMEVMPDGSMHMLVLRLPPPEGGVETKLYYSRSVDNGLTWLPPTEVIGGDLTEIAIGNVLGRGIFRFWQETSNGVVTNFLQSSDDNGETWSETMNFIAMDSLTPTSHYTMDIGGQLHLIQIAEGVNNQLLMQEWVWSGATWKAETLVEIDTGGLSNRSAIALSIRTDGHIGVLFSKLVENSASGQTELVFTERQLNVIAPELPPLEPTPVPSPTPLPVETATATPEITAVPTEASALPDVAPQNDNLILELLFGFVMAVIVVIVAFFLINRFVRRTG